MYRVLLEGTTTDSFGIWGTLLMFVPLIIIIYFFMIRPENKRKKKAKQMRDELIVGDEITTIGGIVGRIVNIKDEDLIIESGFDKSRIKVKKWAVSSKDEKISD